LRDDYQGFPFVVARAPVALTLGRLPRYLVLDPVSTVRLEVDSSGPSCELDVALENPKPGRSLILLIGPHGGPLVHRVRLSGRTRLRLEAKDDDSHVLMLANPQKEPLILRLRGYVLRPRRKGPPASRGRARKGFPSAARRPPARQAPGPTAGRPRRPSAG